MKEYFKYKFGYVNIDDENLYFTSTGNWSETKNMKEKGLQKQKSFKKISIKVFFSILVLAITLIILKHLNSGEIGSFSIIGLPIVGGYLAYKYLRTELGSQFKLPIAKINSIEILDSNIDFVFIDANGNTKTYQVEAADEKGIEIITKIKASIITN